MNFFYAGWVDGGGGTNSLGLGFDNALNDCLIIYFHIDLHLVLKVNGRLWLYLTLADVVLRFNINIKVV